MSGFSYAHTECRAGMSQKCFRLYGQFTWREEILQVGTKLKHIYSLNSYPSYSTVCSHLSIFNNSVSSKTFKC